MTSHWDEFSKSLSEESLPRRESLRRLGAVFAGAVLSPLGVGTAWARGPDSCRAFCKCRNKSQQNACLAACQACNNDPSRLAGSCGSYTCCAAGQTNCGPYCAQLGTDRHCGFCGHDCASTGQTCCGNYCTDLGNDPWNCGACGYACEEPGPYEYGACISGNCEYACAEGAVYCNGFCTFLDGDVDNCGACGNVCPGSVPCVQGECICHTTMCGNSCVNVWNDPMNCGACGNVCGPDTPDCYNGVCGDYCPPGFTLCGAGGYCSGLNDDSNCGGCYATCPPTTTCMGGVCGSYPPDQWYT